MKKGLCGCVLFLVMALAASPLFGQAEKIERSEDQIEREKILRQKIEKAPEEAVIEEKLPPAPAAPAPGEKISITQITVTGVNRFPESEIRAIIFPFENKELTMREMQQAADLITDRYRRSGLVTFRAYLPPQKIQGGILEIRVVEGLTGDIEINR